MKPLNDFTKDEKSQLLYLETRLVDYAGKVDGKYMNAGDWLIMEEWKKEGFIDYGRICWEDAKDSPNGTIWCTFSDLAWEYAHQQRKIRHKKSWEKRTWSTTAELKD